MSAEAEEEEARLRAAMRPERLDEIERVLREICADGVPFQWRDCLSKRRHDAPDRAFRTDVVYLQFTCGCEICPRLNHSIVLTCFPERISSSMSELPDAVMLLRSPYQTSVQFWSRVHACAVDGHDAFRTTKKTDDIMCDAKSLFYAWCLPGIVRALDYIFTCVLDHIATVPDPHTHERLLPCCFASIPRAFPRAFAAHVHRWGTSPNELLPIFMSSMEFWQTFDSVRASLQKPLVVDTARYVAVGAHNRLWLGYSKYASSYLRMRFPNVVHVVADAVGQAGMGVDVLAAFSNARAVELYRCSYASTDVWPMLKFILSMPHLEQCVIEFTPAFGPLLIFPNMEPAHNYTVPKIAQDICNFVSSRRSLWELTAADYMSTPRRPLPIKEDAPTVWRCFFGSPIFERQTLGIVARFLYKANFIQATNQLPAPKAAGRRAE